MEDFTTFRKQVASNLSYYRKKCGLTQSAVAEKLNYSDKAISKWERGDGIPDAYVLSNLAQIYGVSVDILLCKPQDDRPDDVEDIDDFAIKEKKRKHRYISILSVGLALFISIVVFVILSIVFNDSGRFIFVLLWGIPAASIVALVFNSLWGRAFNNTYIESVLLWAIVIALIVTLDQYVNIENPWLLLLIPFSFQLLIILWNNMLSSGKLNNHKKSTSK